MVHVKALFLQPESIKYISIRESPPFCLICRKDKQCYMQIPASSMAYCIIAVDNLLGLSKQTYL